MKLMRNPQDGAQPNLAPRTMRFHLSGVISMVHKDWAGTIHRFLPQRHINLEQAAINSQWATIPYIYHPFYYCHRYVPGLHNQRLGRNTPLGWLECHMYGDESMIAAPSLTQHIAWISSVIRRMSSPNQNFQVPQNIHPQPV